MAQGADEGFSLLRGGAPSGEAILWIHGYTMNATIWEEHWRLMPGYRHLAVELPAHGGAPDLGPRETLGSWSDRLAALAEAEGVRHVVAVSFGGLAALVVAARLGASLHTLVLCSPAIPGMDTDPDAQSCNLALIRQMRQRGRGPWLTETWLTWPHAIFTGMRARPRRWEALRAIIEQHAWLELESGSVGRMSVEPGSSTSMKAIRAKTLLLMGDEDIVGFKRNVQALLRKIAGARKHRVPGCGHLALLEEPAAMIELVVDHLQRARS